MQVILEGWVVTGLRLPLGEFKIHEIFCVKTHKKRERAKVKVQRTIQNVLKEAGDSMSSPRTTPSDIAMVKLNIAAKHHQAL